MSVCPSVCLHLICDIYNMSKYCQAFFRLCVAKSEEYGHILISPDSYSTCQCSITILLEVFLLISSPEPKALGELIGWEGSVVRRPSSSSVHNFKRLLL